MSSENNRFYKRNLPHYTTPNSILFVTFRLAGTIPNHIVENLKSELEFKLNRIEIEKYPPQYGKKLSEIEYKKHFLAIDEYIDNNSMIVFLKREDIAQIVMDSLFFHDKVDYDLIAFTIMPNHVHLVVRYTNTEKPFYEIMKSIKLYSARHANVLLGRRGQFWQPESYDHVIRNDEEYRNVIKYVLNNPVKAKLIEHWKSWKFSYLRYEIDDIL